MLSALNFLLLGAVAALGFAPLGLWPLTLGALAVWMHCVRTAGNARTAAWWGWLFGVGHFTINNNWIQHAFDFQDAMPPVLGYLAPFALALYLAIFPMTAALIAWRWRGARVDAAYVLLFGAAWVATEWLRGWLFTGYPWDPLAAIWIDLPPVPRLTAWVGTYALSGLTVVAAGSLLLLGRVRQKGVLRPAVVFWPLALCGLLAAVDLSTPAPLPVPPNEPRLVVVQPNIGNAERDDAAGLRSLQALIRDTGEPDGRPRLVVWPEGLILDLLEDGYPDEWYQRSPTAIRHAIASVLGPRDLLLTNATTLTFGPTGEVTGAGNSVLAIDRQARIAGRYDKAHLVPYGEYLPMPWLLKPLGLAQLVPGGMDFTSGPGPRNIDVPGLGPVGIQVCYEIVFSGEVVDPAQRPRLIFNPSNDAWFGRWGPPQHLAQARLRAIEEGLPIVRATPTGISAVISATGTLLSYVPFGRAGVLNVPVPPALPPTLFSWAGNWLALAVGAVLVAGAVALRRRAR